LYSESNAKGGGKKNFIKHNGGEKGRGNWGREGITYTSDRGGGGHFHLPSSMGGRGKSGERGRLNLSHLHWGKKKKKDWPHCMI